MKNARLINWLAGTTAVASIASLFLSFHPFPPDIDHRLHEAVGETLADEAIKLREGNARIIVLARDTGSFEVPAAEAQLEAFLRAITKHGLNTPIVRLLKVDPLRAAAVPPGDFFDLLRLGNESDVIVSFLGPPMLGADQAARLPANHPRVIALCSGGLPARTDLKRLFDLKLITAAVVSQPDAPAQAAASNKQEAFGQMFRLITLANVSDLAGVTSEIR
jgi:hypothetical protein